MQSRKGAVNEGVSQLWSHFDVFPPPSALHSTKPTTTEVTKRKQRTSRDCESERAPPRTRKDTPPRSSPAARHLVCAKAARGLAACETESWRWWGRQPWKLSDGKCAPSNGERLGPIRHLEFLRNFNKSFRTFKALNQQLAQKVYKCVNMFSETEILTEQTQVPLSNWSVAPRLSPPVRVHGVQKNSKYLVPVWSTSKIDHLRSQSSNCRFHFRFVASEEASWACAVESCGRKVLCFRDGWPAPNAEENLFGINTLIAVRENDLMRVES
ncbi:hypothetical protein GEV33_002952 [Tenebrio molitor]|uniref:Uncharacterized protein n=1 Tax=Tenebrio molitor TaxID=7067 RepID=A0A8J6HS60_TENMO|nr:hypothetical protein GEV33_002952 [Tenebrio molitor]